MSGEYVGSRSLGTVRGAGCSSTKKQSKERPKRNLKPETGKQKTGVSRLMLLRTTVPAHTGMDAPFGVIALANSIRVF